MCGIVGYIGHKQAYPVLINGLKRLEYRGYDSSGVSILNGDVKTFKRKGKVSDLEDFVKGKDIEGCIGIGHTRWATHGEPNDVNAHPHTSMNGHFTLIHNGIIENYATLKKKLELRNYTFKSETDTEVLVNLIEYIYLKGNATAEMAVRLALQKVVGAYGLVIICRDEKDKLIAARKGSPLVIGVGDDEYFIASDATPIVQYTKSVIYLNDDDVAVIQRGELSLKTIRNDKQTPIIHQINIEIGDVNFFGSIYTIARYWVIDLNLDMVIAVGSENLDEKPAGTKGVVAAPRVARSTVSIHWEVEPTGVSLGQPSFRPKPTSAANGTRNFNEAASHTP